MDDFNKYDKYNNQNNSWNYTPGNNPDQYSYSYYKYNEDKYDDLKTSSFYNEGYKKPSRGKLKGLVVPMIVVALISSLLTGGIVGAYFTYFIPENSSSNNGSYKNPDITPIKQIEIVDNTVSVESAVAEKVSPSIVGVSVSFQSSNFLFGLQESQGSGSGIIYRSDGYIITNNHVIEDAMLGSSGNKIAPGSKIQVILPNQVDKPYDATVVGRDVKTDLAILKINASELPAADFGNSDEVRVGEKAIAIGNPAGLEFMGSVTSGIISGLNRELKFDDGKSMKLIQTDAAINPGNSGGALLNSKGEVIGINTSKIGGANFEGLGFAIPSNIAVEVAESLIESGYVKGRPQLGITVDTRFNSEIAKRNNVPEGILVYSVEPLSGAYQAGIRTGDIITKFNGVPITTFNELETQKNKYKAGDTVEVTIYRIPESGAVSEGKYMTLKVVLGEDKG
ncbi:MAG: PDZ domain-containing protein [Clostridiaceae bacterium]|nr:PDZ domain-containing protein [Clostridiaceae bacterium]